MITIASKHDQTLPNPSIYTKWGGTSNPKGIEELATIESILKLGDLANKEVLTKLCAVLSEGIVPSNPEAIMAMVITGGLLDTQSLPIGVISSVSNVTGPGKWILSFSEPSISEIEYREEMGDLADDTHELPDIVHDGKSCRRLIFLDTESQLMIYLNGWCILAARSGFLPTNSHISLNDRVSSVVTLAKLPFITDDDFSNDVCKFILALSTYRTPNGNSFNLWMDLNGHLRITYNALSDLTEYPDAVVEESDEGFIRVYLKGARTPIYVDSCKNRLAVFDIGAELDLLGEM